MQLSTRCCISAFQHGSHGSIILRRERLILEAETLTEFIVRRSFRIRDHHGLEWVNFGWRSEFQALLTGAKRVLSFAEIGYG